MSWIRRGLVLCITVLLPLAGHAGGARAAQRFSVFGGGSSASGYFGASPAAAHVTFKDVRTGQVFSCDAGPSFRFNMPSQSHVSGANLGSVVSGQTGVHCAGPLGFDETLDSIVFPWPINAVSYDQGIVRGNIANVHYHMVGRYCTFSLAGYVDFEFSNDSRRIAFSLSPQTLKITALSGCASSSIAATGDPVTVTAIYNIAPQTLTIVNG